MSVVGVLTSVAVVVTPVIELEVQITELCDSVLPVVLELEFMEDKTDDSVSMVDDDWL